MGTNAFLTQLNPSVGLVASFGEDAAQAAGGTRGATALTFRELFDDVRFFQKNQRPYDENRSRTLSASRLDLIALQDAISKKTPFVFNVDRASDITAVIALSKEVGIRPIISGGAEAWMVAEALAKDKITVIVQPLQNLPFSFESLGSRADNAALLEAAGVPVIISTFDTHRGNTLRQYAGNAVRAGMTHDGALKAITLEAAQAFGMQKTHGSLEKGKIANIVVWSGDPFESLTQAEYVFIQGKRASLETRQTRLFEKYRTLQRRGEPAEKSAKKPLETEKD
jgi:imidazolonepropionase-like amidohydrolase